MLTKTLRRTVIVALVLLAASTIHAQTLDQTLSGCNGASPLRTINATPSDYRSKIAGLIPGDRLLLAGGTYTQGLPIHNKHGEPGKCIVFEGPASGTPATFTGSTSWNIVSLKDSSYIAVRNLSLDGQALDGDGVKAEATAVSVHHVLIEGLSFRNFNRDYLHVAISTKCPAWNWVVRKNTINSTGTGMYFGNSDGYKEFVNSLIEYNLVYDTLDYNIQVKHQLTRSTSIGAPSSGTTIIRHNVLSKETGSLSGDFARPNLLVGHWPVSGPGSTDIYQIYGNVLYQNPYEGLFQGEGNVAFYNNLLVNRLNDGVRIQAHNHVPRRMEIFNNTIIAAGYGIRIAGADPAYPQRVVGNAVFAGTPLSGGTQSNNVTGTVSQASTYLNNPGANLGAGLDLFPKSGQLQGTAIDYTPFNGFLEWDRDFNGTTRVNTFRGAYSGSGTNPGWAPALAIKPATGGGGGGSNVLQNGVPVTGISGALGTQQLWTMTVPTGATNLQFQTSGGTGDADMHVRFGTPPTLSTYDCRPYESGNNELCTFPTPAAGTWHVMLDAYTAFSGLTLVGSYSSCSAISDVEPNDSRSAAQVLSGSCNQISGTFLNDSSSQQNDFFRLSVPAGKTMTALLNGLSVDYDLYLYNSSGTEIAASENGGTTADQVTYTNGNSTAVTIYVLVWRYSSTRTTYQLKVSY